MINQELKELMQLNDFLMQALIGGHYFDYHVDSNLNINIVEVA